MGEGKLSAGDLAGPGEDSSAFVVSAAFSSMSKKRLNLERPALAGAAAVEGVPDEPASDTGDTLSVFPPMLLKKDGAEAGCAKRRSNDCVALTSGGVPDPASDPDSFFGSGLRPLSLSRLFSGTYSASFDSKLAAPPSICAFIANLKICKSSIPAAAAPSVFLNSAMLTSGMSKSPSLSWRLLLAREPKLSARDGWSPELRQLPEAFGSVKNVNGGETTAVGNRPPVTTPHLSCLVLTSTLPSPCPYIHEVHRRP